MGKLGSFFAFWRSEPRAQRAMMEQRAAIAMSPDPRLIGKAQWLPSSIGNYDRHAYRKVALIFRCVQYLANAAGTAEIQLSDPSGKEAEASHPLMQLMARPNYGMGGQRFMSFIAMVMAVTNFCVIEKERDRAGRVIGLWPLRSDWVRPILRKDGLIDWEYRVPNRTPPYPRLKAEDCVVISFADTPDNNPMGVGPMESVLREAQISTALTDFLNAFMERGAMPLYVMIPTTEGDAADQWNDPETIKIWQERFQQTYGGLPRAVTPMPLVGIQDIKQLGFNFNDLAYPELNDLTDARICLAFGVSPILVDAQVGLKESTYANKSEARKTFYEDTMEMLWTRIDDALTRHLLPEFETAPGWDIHFDTSKIPALQDNQNELWDRTTKAFLAGEISRHTSQKLKGVDLHGDDEFLIPFSVTSVPVTKNQQRSRAFVSELQARALPELTPDGLEEPISEAEITEALSWFDESFPALADLLDATVDDADV